MGMTAVKLCMVIGMGPQIVATTMPSVPVLFPGT